jgi:predicted Zn-ribbon and HTH transcriptional regulator
MLFDLLHCDRCGRERIVSYALEGPKGRCRCGGRFHSEAPPRCPSCKSAEFEEDPEGMHADFD